MEGLENRQLLTFFFGSFIDSYENFDALNDGNNGNTAWHTGQQAVYDWSRVLGGLIRTEDDEEPITNATYPYESSGRISFEIYFKAVDEILDENGDPTGASAATKITKIGWVANDYDPNLGAPEYYRDTPYRADIEVAIDGGTAAGGAGWYFDSTPWDDVEFTEMISPFAARKPGARPRLLHGDGPRTRSLLRHGDGGLYRRHDLE